MRQTNFILIPVEQSNLFFFVCFNFKKTSWKQRASLYLDLYKIDRYEQVDMQYIYTYVVETADIKIILCWKLSGNTTDLVEIDNIKNVLGNMLLLHI